MNKNLLSTVCKCGHKFGVNDIRLPFEKAPPGFYGGRVGRFSYARCRCGMKYKLYIRQTGKSWEVIDMEPKGEDLSLLTNAELSRMALERGIKVPPKANKERLINLLGGRP